MQMATATHLLTYEEWLQMPVVEDGTDEVVNGVLRFTAPTRYPHAEIIQRLIMAMYSHIDPKRGSACRRCGCAILRNRRSKCGGSRVAA